jgi:hypothetical protein
MSIFFNKQNLIIKRITLLLAFVGLIAFSQTNTDIVGECL